MLAADKTALSKELRLNMLNLQWKELQFLHSNFVNLTVTSTVLVGFGITSFQISQTYKPTSLDGEYVSIWELGREHWGSWYFVFQLVADALFVSSASLGLTWNILTLFIASLSVMCGPGMALRGPEGSVAVSVRHLESMLKRALRFFGRGIAAFTFSMITLGFRQAHTIAFAGGIISVIVGAFTIYMLWTYGSDIAEKFHVSPERAIRGTFVYSSTGVPEWKNTAAEVAENEVTAGWWICGFEISRNTRRWRPEGHGTTTPLWRADKLIGFPYHDDERLMMKNALLRGGTTADAYAAVSVEAGAQNERVQMRHMIDNAQGTDRGQGSSGQSPPGSHSPGMTFEAIDPWQAMSLVGQALTGGGTDNSTSARRGAADCTSSPSSLTSYPRSASDRS